MLNRRSILSLFAVSPVAAVAGLSNSPGDVVAGETAYGLKDLPAVPAIGDKLEFEYVRSWREDQAASVFPIGEAKSSLFPSKFVATCSEVSASKLFPNHTAGRYEFEDANLRLGLTVVRLDDEIRVAPVKPVYYIEQFYFTTKRDYPEID